MERSRSKREEENEGVVEFLWRFSQFQTIFSIESERESYLLKTGFCTIHFWRNKDKGS